MSETRDPGPETEEFLVVAQVLAPHGVRGELKCRLVTDFPDRFKRGTRVYAGTPPTQYSVRGARVVGDHVYLTLRGVDDRDAAGALRGSEVLVTAADAVPLPEGRFYWREVIGLRVEDASGRELGRVADILPTGANDVYVVKGDLGEILVPAIKDVVKSIDPSEGRIVVELLPGLLPAARPAKRRSFGRPRGWRGRVPARHVGGPPAGS